MLKFRAGMEIHISPYSCGLWWSGGGLDLQSEIKQVIHAPQFPDIPPDVKTYKSHVCEEITG